MRQRILGVFGAAVAASIMLTGAAEAAARCRNTGSFERWMEGFKKDAAAQGAKAFFTVVIPGDAAAKRAENYKLAVECYAPIADACAKAGAFIAVEGWPGGFPYFASLMCSPETVRSFLKDVGRGVALNYDPSHLIRLRVDHIRFLKEFAEHVKHVHAKDTDVDAEALYEFGTQPGTFATPHRWGDWT